MKSFKVIETLAEAISTAARILDVTIEKYDAEELECDDRTRLVYEITGNEWLIISGACSMVRELFWGLPEDVIENSPQKVRENIEQFYPHLFKVEGDGQDSNRLYLDELDMLTHHIHSFAYAELRVARAYRD